jgi:hypothetical protein
VNTGGIRPHHPQYGPIGEGSTYSGAWGITCPAHQRGAIDRQLLQPATSIDNLSNDSPVGRGRSQGLHGIDVGPVSGTSRRR